jgi:tetratricopeptide (TPR) repeat protein
MKQLRLSHLAVIIAAIGFSAAPELTNIAANTAYAQEAMRPEVGKIVQAAGELYKARKYKDALSKLHETDSISGKTVNENFTIERMRLSLASAAGDSGTVIRSAEIIVAANRLSGKEQLQLIQVLANAYFTAGNYSKAVQAYGRYFSEGGTDSSLRPYMIRAMSLSGDTARAMKEVKADLAADEKAGRVPSQSNLEFYANAALKQNDRAGYNSALEKLISFHGKKEYWANLLNGIERKPGFSQRLALDLYRLKLAVGQITKTADYMEMSQLALQSGFAVESMSIIDRGFKVGALGTGTETARHNRLRELAKKTVIANKKAMEENEIEAKQNKDGFGLTTVGFAYAMRGDFDKGIALMEEGLSKGLSKQTEDAKLHLGIALFQAGKKSNAIKEWKSVEGKDGTGDLARYWIIYASQSGK